MVVQHPPNQDNGHTPQWSNDWLNAQYNNRALVPEHGQHLAHWAAASAAARASQPCTLDVAYSAKGAPAKETLDVFPALLPDGTPRRASSPLAPVLVFLHGGYWRSLDKADHSFIAPAFTAAGVCVVVPNYALCPAVTVAEIGEQMLQALTWVHKHIAQWGGDARRVVLVGHSAGGQLAAWLLAQAPYMAHAAVALSGLFDLEPLRHTPFLQETLQLTPAQVRACSPIHQSPPRHGALWALVGGKESAEFLRQNQLIQDVWGTSVVPHAQALAELHHFSILDSLAQTGSELHTSVLQCLRSLVSVKERHESQCRK
ncbi:MAG: Carboxylesterase NlhH [Pseudomonadota bacterium]